MTPPKPAARAGDVPLWRYARLFRRDILSAQPERLYKARMAEFRTPFFRSFFLGEPGLVREVLNARPGDFPKSARVTEGLRPLLGRAVFITNGADWARQRRIIDPAFQGGRPEASFAAMDAAARAMAARLAPGRHEVEAITSHAAADVIFRTLFSVPIEDETAARVARAFARYQAAQPILGLRALLPLPDWVPRWPRPALTRAAREIRGLIAGMVARRAAEIDAGSAPDDLATRIMTARDPETGEALSRGEMTDQVAIFFLAGHETSAAAVAWALYLLATHPEAQARAADEARAFVSDPVPGTLRRMPFLRDVFRETLRLYPPVPMMVREATRQEEFRGRRLGPGAQIVLSPWHMHRNPRHWQAPDAFDPDRWSDKDGRGAAREAYLPFSQGPRVCPGAGFAMTEAAILLSRILADWDLAPSGEAPRVAARLTVRSTDGIYLEFTPRRP